MQNFIASMSDSLGQILPQNSIHTTLNALVNSLVGCISEILCLIKGILVSFKLKRMSDVGTTMCRSDRGCTEMAYDGKSVRLHCTKIAAPKIYSRSLPTSF